MPPVNNRSTLLGFPRSFGIIIGINDYPGINAHLKSAVPDATRLAKVLKEEQGFDYVEFLENPGKADILDLLARLKDPAREPVIQPKDSLVFYYAGHGKAGEFDQGPAGFLLPSDAKPQSAALDNDSLVKMEEVFDTLHSLNCHHTLLILDCCFAGKFRYVGQKSRDTEAPFFMPLYEERFERYKRKKAWQVLVSAGPDQTAADWMGDRAEGSSSVHSPFALALFESLEGKAEIKPKGKNLGDGVLTVQELFLYLWNVVEKKTNENARFTTQYPDLFPMGDHKGGQFIFFDPKNKLNFANRVERNPYKGLHPYKEEDQDLFFGRNKAVEDLSQKIQHSPILVVSAPSGLGKSSVVRAGLWPRLKEKEGFEQCFVIRPGSRPSEQLDALTELDPAKKQLLIVDQYEELFTETEDETEREAFEKRMIDLLEKARNGQLRIVLTIRSDFDWQLSESAFGKAFWDPKVLYMFLYRLAPLNLDELREVLVNPAWVEAFDFESEDLVDTILQEISYAPGALPLLSFTMGELYRITDKDNRIFTRKNYQEKLGGVNGALSKRADELYASLNPEEQNMMRLLLLRMVRLNDGNFTRRRVFLSADAASRAKGLSHELDYPNDEQDQTLAKVIATLGDSLLVKGKDELGRAYLEPVHDSLINFWPRCLGWIQDFGKESILLQRQLWQAVLDAGNPPDYPGATVDPNANSAWWDKNPKLMQVLQLILDPGDKWLCQVPDTVVSQIPFLLWEDEPGEEKLKKLLPLQSHFKDSDTPVEIFREIKKDMDNWLNLNELQFIRKSWEHRESQIALLKRQRDEARASALSAQSLLNGGRDATLALNLALQALRLAPGEESARALLGVLSPANNHFYCKKFRHTRELITLDSPVPEPENINCVDISPDGKRIVTDGHLGSIKIWDLQGNELYHFPTPPDDEGSTYYAFVRFLPDGKSVLAMKGYSGKSFVWDPEKNKVRPFPKSPERIEAFALAPDGKQVLVKLGKEGVWKWDPQTDQITAEPTPPDLPQLSSPTNEVLSPDGKRVCTFNTDTFKVWEKEGGKTLFEYKEPAPGEKGINAVAFTPDGNFLLSGHNDSYARLWKIENRLIRSISVADARPFDVFGAHPTPSGYFFFSIRRGPTHVYDKKGRKICTLEKGSSVVTCDPEGTLILSSGGKGIVNQWDFSGNLVRSFTGLHQGYISSLHLTPDARRFLTYAEDNKLNMWDLEGNLVREIAAFSGRSIYNISVDTRCGLILVAAGREEVGIWDLDGKKAHSLDPADDKNASINALAISPDKRWIVGPGSDMEMRIWDFDSSRPVKTWPTQSDHIYELHFSADGQYLLGGGNNGITVWDLDGHKLMNYSDSGMVSSFCLSPDEQFIYAGDSAGENVKGYIWKNRLWELQQGMIEGFDELERERFGMTNDE